MVIHLITLKKATILVKSTAIKNKNGELKYIRKNKIPIYSRAEILADVVSLKKNIIITGSHGKTTTTSLVAKFCQTKNWIQLLLMEE